MLFRQVSRGSPEKVFVAVRNCCGTTLNVGMAPIFDYISSEYQDGVNVTLRDVGNYRAIGLVAGIVATHDIEPGEFGMCQCYGHVDSMILATQGANSTNPLTGYNTTSLDKYQLWPVGVATDAVKAGCLYTATASFSLHVVSNLCRIWLGTLYSNGETTNTHDEDHTTVMVKGFIKAM